MNVFKEVLNSLKKTWRGEEKFWKVFWLWGVLGNLIVWVTVYLLFGHNNMTPFLRGVIVSNFIYYIFSIFFVIKNSKSFLKKFFAFLEFVLTTVLVNIIAFAIISCIWAGEISVWSGYFIIFFINEITKLIV